MIKQFFGFEFRISLIVLALLYVFALFGYFAGFPSEILGLVFIATALLTMANIEFGVLLAFLELFSSPHGQLLSTELFGFTVSLRMAIFSAVMLAWGMQISQQRISLKVDDRIRMFIVLAAAVLVGVIVGAFQNPLKDVFADGNAYLYLLYVLPILSIRWTTKKQKTLLQVLAAGATLSVLVTFIALFIFSHFNEVVLSTSYGFLRDLRIAEITDLGGGFYRVFQQTHFFIIVLMLLVFSVVLQKKKFTAPSIFVSGAGLSVVLLSLSRSFWLGSVVAIAVLAVFMLIKFKPQLKEFFSLSGGLVISGVAGILLIIAVTLFPFPQQNLSGSDLADALTKRATESNDVAVSSRWKLLDPMLDEIFSNPIEGSGFGASVTFESDDPRVREIDEEGTWTTYAMEWGWLEVWMKMGVLAPIGFLLIFISLWRRFLKNKNEPRTWLHAGLSAGLLFLVVTHFFSPYLNHPIGLGFILYCIPFLPAKTKEEAKVLASGLVKMKKPEVPAMASKVSK